jgi:hypothetical protein
VLNVAIRMNSRHAKCAAICALITVCVLSVMIRIQVVSDIPHPREAPRNKSDVYKVTRKQLSYFEIVSHFNIKVQALAYTSAID